MCKTEWHGVEEEEMINNLFLREFYIVFLYVIWIILESGSRIQ